jgi:hypothetical protein
MGQGELFTAVQIASMRVRSRRRNYSAEAEEFRREHERHRSWGLRQRHGRKMCRLYGSTAAAWAVWQARADEVLSGLPSVEAARMSPEPVVADVAAVAAVSGPVQFEPVPPGPASVAPVQPAGVPYEQAICAPVASLPAMLEVVVSEFVTGAAANGRDSVGMSPVEDLRAEPRLGMESDRRAASGRGAWRELSPGRELNAGRELGVGRELTTGPDLRVELGPAGRSGPLPVSRIPPRPNRNTPTRPADKRHPEQRRTSLPGRAGRNRSGIPPVGIARANPSLIPTPGRRRWASGRWYSGGRSRPIERDFQGDSGNPQNGSEGT